MIPAKLDWLHAGVATSAAAGASLFFRRLWQRDPDQAERRRRERVDRVGRLAQCEILDVVEEEISAPAIVARAQPGSLILSKTPLPRRLLVAYRYSIAGVRYETKQDVAQTWPQVPPPLPGQVASIKYDPASPSNSILVSGSWLRRGAAAPKTAEPEKGK